MLPIRASAQDGPAIGVWNSYLDHTVFVECISAGAPATVRIRVVSNTQALFGEQVLALGADASGHFFLNSLNLGERYGTLQIEVTEGSAANVSCHTVTYRLKYTLSEIEYAFSQPIAKGINGISSGIYNSFNPTSAPQPVANWLSIINLDSSAKSFSVRAYPSVGATEEEGYRVESLFPGERRDVPLVGSGLSVIGVYEVEPDDSSALYNAFVTRYAPDIEANTYAYAFPLLAAQPSCDEQLLQASSMGNALNWLELANPSTSTAQVDVEVRRTDGGVTLFSYKP